MAIAIYAAFIATYLVAPTAWWRVLLAIVDGPLVVAIAAVTLHGWRVLDLTTALKRAQEDESCARCFVA